MRTLVSHASGRWFETGRVRLREPFLERGARECGAGAWQQSARGPQAPVGIGGLARALDPRRVAAPGGEESRHLDQALRPRARDLGDGGLGQRDAVASLASASPTARAATSWVRISGK